VLLAYVDPSTYELDKRFISLVPLTGYRHDGETLAHLLAERIDEVTTEQQFLAFSVCDGGSNVINAMNLLLHNNEEMQKKKKERLMSLWAAGADHLRHDSDSDSDDEVVDDDDNDLQLDSDVERLRVSGCCAHAMHNASKDMLKVDGIAELLHKADALIKAARQSTLCLQRLEALQRASNVRVVVAIAPSRTRW